jgi:uncharacterized protein
MKVLWDFSKKEAVMSRHIIVTGGTGFVGGHFIDYFINHGDRVTVISRTAKLRGRQGVAYVTWSQVEAADSSLEGADAIVHLAGETINQRWTNKAKERILQSRLTTTTRIAKLVSQLQNKPKVVISGSGMSIYGTSETDSYDESSPARITDFLADVVRQWEGAADSITDTRLVKIRIGLVLGNGGALPPMALPYRLFGGGRVGSGRQWLSWIHINDMVRLIDFCIRNESITGPVNATAPNPLRNDDFGRTIGKVLRRPHWFPVPSFLFKAIFGELSVLLLKGQRVIPRKLLDHGFEFQYSTLEPALKDVWNRP